MNTAPRRFSRAGLSGRRLGAVLLVAGIALTNVWSGCTVTKGNYKTLALFFDGVPDPDAARAPVGAATGPVAASASLSMHPPYAQENCDDCHSSRVRMTKNDSTICGTCHAGKEREHERMHGPVAAKACLWCHNPHESPQRHLLRAEDRALCSQCHVPALLSTARVPEHADATRACLECHSGHGGARPFMLRDTPARPPPQVAPPVSPPPAPIQENP